MSNESSDDPETGRPTALAFQVAFDAHDPHRVADFWAAALHYTKEDHSAIVRQLLEAGQIQDDDTVEVDVGLGFRDAAACQDPAGLRPRLYFQRVPESKTVKNRVHLDIHVGSDQVEQEADRLEDLGATRAWISHDRGPYTITLRDPEGNELCLH